MTKRLSITQDPFIHLNKDKFWRERGNWPCRWISCPEAGEAPFVTAYHLRFTLTEAADIPIHVTADERYDLFLDGQRIGRGSERGDADNWFYESYLLTLSAGEHVLAARVWALGNQRPFAQMSVSPGFLLCAEGDWGTLLSTGLARWQSKKLKGYQFVIPPAAYWRGARIELDGRAFPWGYERGLGDGWQPARKNEPGVGRVTAQTWHQVHRLQPAPLPPMLDEARRVGRVRYVADPGDAPSRRPIRAADHLPQEAAQWQNLLLGQGEVTVPPHTRRRILFDLEEYYCLYPELSVSGGDGAKLRLHSAEALVLSPTADNQQKGHRDQIEGKYFPGIGDAFQTDGGAQRVLDTLWWQAGRYWELLVETFDQPLTLHRLTLRETRYPLEMESRFQADDPRLQSILPVMLRSLQLCSHETYYDAPYYEELMYAGDARLEMLTTYAISRDDRLPRKAIRLFNSSRLSSGLTQARYPSWETQVIPPFALWWVAMLRDYAYWRDDPAFVRRFLPGMRNALEGYHHFVDHSGLLRSPEGWNFMDWLPAWPDGVPPDAVDGYNGLLNWHFVYTLILAADLETQLGEAELARLWRRRAQDLAARAVAVFWDEERGLLAEDAARQHFSEHTQSLALLSGLLNETQRARLANGLLSDPDLLRTTYYFSHYLFEAYRALERVDALLARLADWYALPQLGLKTTIEKPEPTRSDCHAWSAHPLFHYFATILGIRPVAPGFRAVEIRPQLAGLSQAEGTLVHPLGRIRVQFRIEGSLLYANISLPDGVTGALHVGGKTYPLTASSAALKINL